MSTKTTRAERVFPQNPDSVLRPQPQSLTVDHPPARPHLAGHRQTNDGFLCFTHEQTPTRYTFGTSIDVLFAP